MEVGMILELIGTVGFPIAMVIALGLFVYKLWQQSVEREKLLMTEITENRLVNQQFAEIIASHTSELGQIKTDIREIKHVLEIPDQNQE